MAEAGRPVLLAVAGPKGGVGKSFLSLNLSVALARRGRSVVLADLDLGAANLHALLGLGGAGAGLASFVYRGGELGEHLVDTPVAELRLLAGSTDSLGLANLLQWQKIKLLGHLIRLPAEVVVLDLGAGTAFNTLDFYDAAQVGLLVSTPEMTSILNAYAFLKSLVFRLFLRRLKAPRLAGARRLVEEASQPQPEEGLKDVPALVDQVAALDGAAGAALRRVLDEIRPCLVLNMLDQPRQGRAAEALARLTERRLGIGLDLLGQVPFDAQVRRSVALMEPLLLASPGAPAGLAVTAMADRLLPLLAQATRSPGPAAAEK